MPTTQAIFRTRSGGSLELCAASEQRHQQQPEEDPFVALSPDGRSRSSRGSSSDEDTQAWDGFVNQDFRAGGPYICPLPALSFPENSLLRRLQRDRPALAEHIASILRRAIVDVHAVRFCARAWEFETDAGAVPTALIRAAKHSLDEDWATPSRDVRRFLFEHGIRDLAVEIFDRRAEEPDRLHPVPPTDPVFPIWTGVRDTILQNCHTQGWNSIGCHRMGKNDNGDLNPSTILVTVDDVDRDWRAAREAIVAILDGFGLGGVAVKVKRDEIVRMDSLLEKPTLPRSALVDSARVGQSVGRRGYGGSGTFGGWIELRNPNNGRWHSYGLTCSHVVVPEDGPGLANYRVHGVAMDKTHVSSLPVVSPSDSDLSDHREELIQKLTTAKNEDDYIKFENEDRDPTGSLIPSQRTYLNVQRKHITELDRQLQEVETFMAQRRQYLGYVHCSTGDMKLKKRRDENDLPMMLDWAILGVPPHRHGDNKVLTFGRTETISVGDEFSLRTDASASVSNASTVYKCGRATGYTAGKYGYLQEARIATTASAGQVVEQATREHSLVGCGQPFSQPGDSGALVFTASGAVVGMIIGGHKYEHITYMTAIQDLAQDIKETTGATGVRILPRI